MHALEHYAAELVRPGDFRLQTKFVPYSVGAKKPNAEYQIPAKSVVGGYAEFDIDGEIQAMNYDFTIECESLKQAEQIRDLHRQLRNEKRPVIFSGYGMPRHIEGKSYESRVPVNSTEYFEQLKEYVLKGDKKSYSLDQIDTAVLFRPHSVKSRPAGTTNRYSWKDGVALSMQSLQEYDGNDINIIYTVTYSFDQASEADYIKSLFQKMAEQKKYFIIDNVTLPFTTRGREYKSRYSGEMDFQKLCDVLENALGQKKEANKAA